MGEIELPKSHILVGFGGGWRISSLLQKQMCFLGQQLVFEEASNSFERLLGLEVTAKQIERICHHYGEELENQLKEAIEKGNQDERHSTVTSCYAMLLEMLLFTNYTLLKLLKNLESGAE